jgi:hypothetical protein
MVHLLSTNQIFINHGLRVQPDCDHVTQIRFESFFSLELMAAWSYLHSTSLETLL